MGKYPDDCAIEVTYNASNTPPLQLSRPDSNGTYKSLIGFTNGDLTITEPANARNVRFTISFHLSAEDQSGGFKGIKIWDPRKTEPDWNDFSDTPFDLYTYHDGKRCHILSIGDQFSAKGTYKYCLGVFTDQTQSFIYQDDPQIYNTGDVGDCEGGR